MTQAEFTAFYPQFQGFTPSVVMTTYIAQANARFSSFLPEDAEEARRLYTAHRLTLYGMHGLHFLKEQLPAKRLLPPLGRASRRSHPKK